MEWMQVLTIVGVNIALIGAVITIIIWMINKVDSDMKSIGNRLDGHATRIDQLYKMFVDLLKEGKK